ncbi:PIG-L deacetylase family protein, partial [Arthrobacter sp. SO3]|uniref:PIG-L deacetylase family protein n=1 Tax=Arthrobacter sp. SO3 TaxID=1897057 RepID=UPI001CFF72F2
MVSFTHQDTGTSEDAWAASGLAALPELPLDAGELAGQAFIVLAAHPDDESLGAGGLMARLLGLGARVTVLLCTAGEASHPDSPTTTPDQLGAVRLREFGGALTQLLADPDWRFLALPDGRLADRRTEVHAALQHAIAEAAASGLPAERITLVAPYRRDGHTDHEALGCAAAEAAGAGGHGLLEYPIWYWLWADAADPAWHSWLRLPLDPAER